MRGVVLALLADEVPLRTAVADLEAGLAALDDEAPDLGDAVRADWSVLEDALSMTAEIGNAPKTTTDEYIRRAAEDILKLLDEY
jgi:hypothetical protein